jgi:hypothetical protein
MIDAAQSKATRLRKLARDPFKFAGGLQHIVDEAADTGLKRVHETAQFRLALLRGGHCACGLCVAKTMAFEGIVLEDRDGARHVADLIGPVVAGNPDVVPAIRDCRQRVRHRCQRLGDAAHDQHCHRKDEKRREAPGNGHGLHRLRQHDIKLRHRDADIENADRRQDLDAALIAVGGKVQLEPLDPKSLSILASGGSIQEGFLFDFLSNFQDSARQGLQVYRLLGGAGYVWSARRDANGRGHLRFSAIDASALGTPKRLPPIPRSA